MFAPWRAGSDLTISQNFIAPGHVEFRLQAFKSDADLDALQGDSFVLSTAFFTGIANGSSNISFGPDPITECSVLGPNRLSLGQTTLGICVAVGSGSCPKLAVPEPSYTAAGAPVNDGPGHRGTPATMVGRDSALTGTHLARRRRPAGAQ